MSLDSWFMDVARLLRHSAVPENPAEMAAARGLFDQAETMNPCTPLPRAARLRSRFGTRPQEVVVSEPAFAVLQRSCDQWQWTEYCLSLGFRGSLSW